MKKIIKIIVLVLVLVSTQVPLTQSVNASKITCKDGTVKNSPTTDYDCMSNGGILKIEVYDPTLDEDGQPIEDDSTCSSLPSGQSQKCNEVCRGVDASELQGCVNTVRQCYEEATQYRSVDECLGIVADHAAAAAPSAGPCSANDNFFSFPTWYKYLNPTGDECEPVIGSLTDFWLIAAAILEILLRLAAMLSVGFIVWGGFRILTSQGDPNTIKESRDTILNASIGLVIAIIATVSVNFVAGKF